MSDIFQKFIHESTSRLDGGFRVFLWYLLFSIKILLFLYSEYLPFTIVNDRHF